MSSNSANLIREYADGKISWDLMNAKGVQNYLNVLGALGILGLKPPIAPENIQTPARNALRQILRAQQK